MAYSFGEALDGGGLERYVWVSVERMEQGTGKTVVLRSLPRDVGGSHECEDRHVIETECQLSLLRPDVFTEYRTCNRVYSHNILEKRV